jgi:hypothetical protein
MGQGRFRLLFAAVVSLVVLGCITGTAAAKPSCASRLLEDWKDGRIDQTYPVACYRQALADLPEDVRVYSTAQTDITRALQTRLSAAPVKDRGNSKGDGGVSPLLVVAITGGILVAAGSVAAVVR